MRRSMVGVLLVLCLLQLVGSLVHGGQQDSSLGTPASSVEATEETSRDAGQTRLDVAWRNKSVTLDVANVEVHDVLRALSEKSGVEIAVAATVTGKVTLKATNAPLEKVVDDLLAAVGQRNYLMVFDGDGLKKLSIVPKGADGKGLSQAAERAKIRGKLRNGKEIEYFPGEIVLGLKTPPLNTDERIQRLEETYHLSLLNKNHVSGWITARFRILDGRDPLALMYELLSAAESFNITFVTPNGMGELSAQMPEEDFHYIERFTNREAVALRATLHNDPEAPRKYDFVKYDSLQKGKVKLGYVDKEMVISIVGSDGERITYDDITAMLNRENALLIYHRKDRLSEVYVAYFPYLEDGPKALGAKIDELGNDEVFTRAENQFTGFSHNPWGVGNGLEPNDERYASREQWNFSKIRAERAWEIVPSGLVPATIAVIDTGVDASHDDLVSRISNLSKNFETGEVGADKVPDDPDEPHGTAVAGIVGARTNNEKHIAGVAGGWGTEKAGAQLLVEKVNVASFSAWEEQRDAILYSLDKAQVLNLSWDWWNRPRDLYDTILNAFSQGRVIVVAADNLNGDLYWSELPAYVQALRGKVLVVAATTRTDGKWKDGEGWGSWIDLRGHRRRVGSRRWPHRYSAGQSLRTSLWHFVRGPTGCRGCSRTLGHGEDAIAGLRPDQEHD